MTYRDAISGAAEQLKQANILFCDTPLLDASVLMCHASGLSREKLLASYPDTVPEDTASVFNKLIQQRLEGFPVSYIRNVKEFYGRDFIVNPSVLVPRPDTETIIDGVIRIANERRGEPLSLLDLCTGSGCIAATLALELPGLAVTASDLSVDALGVAEANAAALGADVAFIRSDLFSNIRDSFDIIATNPPYLTSSETAGLTDAGWPEPAMALDGGGDGLDLVRRICFSAMDHLNDNGYLLIEAADNQAEEICGLLGNAGFSEINILEDLAGRRRVSVGKKSGTQDKAI